MCAFIQKWSIVVFMATVKWLSLWCRPDGYSLVIVTQNVGWYYMSEDNFLCLTLEDDDLAGLSMLDLELHFLQILPRNYGNGFLKWKTGQNFGLGKNYWCDKIRIM